MSRSGRDDAREGRAPLCQQREGRHEPSEKGLPLRDLRLPKGDAREPVPFRHREYRLTGSETRALAAIGAFRVVAPEDLNRHDDARDVWHGDWRRLADQDLITRTSFADRDNVRHVVSLTREGKALLDAHQDAGPDGRRQEYYAGAVKPRELAHDAQIYRLFEAEAARIEGDGGRIARVVLDYELKREYQRFLNRDDRADDPDVTADRLAFAEAHGLHVIDGHLELPDLRIEYETEDGRLEHRDLELVTEHYSRAQLAGKARAGFSCYRARGAGVGRGGSRRGGTPLDPHNLEWLK